LRPEHFREATPQATQRKITLESLDLVTARRPDVQVFNELLVQYPREGKRRFGQVVPDNMVVKHDRPIVAVGSFDVPEQSAGLFWVLEYVSKNSERKDYEDNFDKYEHDLKVPYYLLFYPDTQDLTLYRHTGEKYVSVRPNGEGRHAIPELELEVALLDGWVRYWFRGELLPLPAELQRGLDEARRQLEQERRRAEQLQQEVEQERQARLSAEEELKRLRAELERARARPPEGR
jgi:Uma2 family endonuclease